LLAAVEDNLPRPEWKEISSRSSTFKTLWRNWDWLAVHDGMLYHRWFNNEGVRAQWQLHGNHPDKP
jgi:hypothetical protein